MEVFASRDDGGAVGGELETSDATTVVAEDGSFGFLGGAVEDADGAIDVTGGEETTRGREVHTVDVLVVLDLRA